MNLKLGRIAIAALVAEVTGVLVLVILVATFGPPGFEAAQPFAERLGRWVGPISGFVLCLAGGFWVAKAADRAHLLNGFAMGTAGAALDVGIALAAGAGLSPLILFSNVGRIIGGTIGGWLAAGTSHARSRPG